MWESVEWIVEFANLTEKAKEFICFFVKTIKEDFEGETARPLEVRYLTALLAEVSSSDRALSI